MQFSFGRFQVDTDAFRLQSGSEQIPVEPRVFDLLALFMRHPGEVIDRDRIIRDVWGGRIVSDAAVSTAIKEVRKALGDDGTQQAFIETVRNRGFRFRAEVDCAGASPALPRPDAPADARPSIAVLPFARLGNAALHPGIEEAIPHEVLIALARLRWLFVIAGNSSFRFRGPGLDLADVGRALDVRYCLTGTVELFPPLLEVSVELADARGRRTVWGAHYARRIEDVHDLRAEIVAGVTAAVDSEIALHEAQIAQAKAPDDLNAWQAFHLGLKMLHQYTAPANAAAEALFRRATLLDPHFARAHAGLSCASFQTAFVGYGADRDAAIAAARRSAERGIDLDPVDPFANFALGRSLWLESDLEGAVPWLERATAISPNFAQGIYTRALVDTLSGRAGVGGADVETAMKLSPLDPLLYAMRAVKSMTHLSAGDDAAAATWADAAARTPRAHVIILLLAAASHHIVGDRHAAASWAAAARARKPGVTAKLFFDDLPFRDEAVRGRLAGALAALGF